MPVHNAERYLHEAMDSVLGQTHREFELIAINDGSTDSTLDILREYEDRDERVRVISHENWGIVRSLNHAINAARHDWIARMDADDVMEPHRLARQVEFISAQPSLALTSCLIRYIDRNGTVLGESHSELTDDEAIRRVQEREGLIILSHPGAMFLRDVARELGGYRPETWPCEDVDLFNRIADAGYRVLVQPEYLLRYRIHPDSVTGYTVRLDDTMQNWLRDCSINRRLGLPEPTREEFDRARANLPFFRRMNDRRRVLASAYYRRATFAYSTGRVFETIRLVAASTLLDPIRAPMHVWRKLVQPKLNRRSMIVGSLPRLKE